jgi:hypothetical protein
MNEYVRYFDDDRTHLGLDMETPAGRKAARATPVNAKVVSIPRLSGLHHRYDLAALDLIARRAQRIQPTKARIACRPNAISPMDSFRRKYSPVYSISFSGSQQEAQLRA